MLFTRVTSKTGKVLLFLHLQCLLLRRLFIHTCGRFLNLRFCKFCNHDISSFSVSKPRMFASNQLISFNSFHINLFCSFDPKRHWDKFCVRGTTRHCQLMALSLQDSQKMPQKLLPKNTWLDQLETFVRMSLRERIFCFARSDGMTPLACLPYARSLMTIALFATTNQLFSQIFLSHAR